MTAVPDVKLFMMRYHLLLPHTPLGPVLSVTLLAVVLLSLTGCSSQSFRPALDAYVFPTKPGTPAWEALASREEMLQAVQVPDATLERMSTAGLVETVLRYPLLTDLVVYSEPQAGLEAVRTDFNGLAALMRRPDAGTALLARYRQIDPAAAEQATLEEVGQYDVQLTTLELVLAQPAIIERLTTSERRTALAEAQRKLQSKQEHEDIYGQSGQERTALYMARLMQQIDSSGFQALLQADPALQAFVRSGMAVSGDTLQQIATHAQQTLR